MLSAYQARRMMPNEKATQLVEYVLSGCQLAQGMAIMILQRDVLITFTLNMISRQQKHS